MKNRLTGIGTTGVADVKSEEQETATASARFFTIHYSLFTLHSSLFTLHFSLKKCNSHSSFFIYNIPPLMNTISLLLLTIVVAAFLIVAYRYFFQKKGRKSCCDTGSDHCSDHCSGCAGCALHDACKRKEG